MDRVGWQAAVHGVAKESDMTQQLSSNNHRLLGSWFFLPAFEECCLPSLASIIPDESESISWACDLCSCRRPHIYLFIYSIYFYQLEANYFTILQWFLPYIDMNQAWIYMCSPSQTPLPPPSHIQKGSVIGYIFCCCCLEILDSLEQ